ncbi:MAG: hypothetical protein B7Y37_11570 [Sphingobacteriia bacterium 28-36-52]|nr:MAG: hypothetical protein B7Y37_11570 [Sphingobacteriia bacterium 28-36-52]
MASAKDNFILRIGTFNSIIRPNLLDDIKLNSKALTETLHNEKVRMLRNGMSIIGFTILEDFIKRRIGEILKIIGTTGCNFNSLPDKLKEDVTFNALKGINNRAETLKRNSEDYITFIQNETGFISSTKNSVYELSEYSIGWDKSNLNSKDVSDILGNLNVEGGWNSIQRLSSIINCSILNPDQVFKNFAMNRHKSAHNTDADSLLTDLESFIDQSKIIAFCFDSLICKSLSYIRSNNTNFLNLTLKTKPLDIKFRYLNEVSGKWKEFANNNFSRAFRSNSDYMTILNEAKLRAQSNNEVLLIKFESNAIRDWYNFQ